MSRLKPQHPEEMAPAQRRYYDTIMNRPNNRHLPEGTPLTGPFHAWQRSPDFAEKLNDWTRYLREAGLLELRLMELVAITVGRVWSAEVVFAAHGPAAVAAGIDSDIVEAIRRSETPEFEKADEAAVYHFIHLLMTTHEVDDGTYQAALDELGEPALVELIGLAGLYATASMTLNAFRIPVRPGMERPYPDKM